MKLELHKGEKHQAVRGWDILSFGLGTMSGLLIVVSVAQPKAPLNALRIPAALVMSIGSVVAERLRETDLLSLDEALGFQKAIKTQKIRKDVMMRETIADLQDEEHLFNSVPVDRWSDIAERTGIMPPNLEARSALQNQAAPQQVLPEPPVQGMATATIDPETDPCEGGYDPEGLDDSPVDVVQDCLIFAVNVEAWFAEKGDAAPDSLVNEWRSAPGIAIKVEDGNASIVRSKNA
jgi:hypothetical protein